MEQDQRLAALTAQTLGGRGGVLTDGSLGQSGHDLWRVVNLTNDNCRLAQ